ncbi:unnamed protein product [Paramecium octaurelia]|uniref:Uncharacterized protein n=1 Tax=Paramecium octaurelia TaxID=43137 RepID=A0A8S1TYC6_PAROT|nr:unnamed protein product [Paramecium octaurelia]
MYSYRNPKILQQDRPSRGSANTKSEMQNTQYINKPETQQFSLQPNNSTKIYESIVQYTSQSSSHDPNQNDYQSTEKQINTLKLSTLTSKFSIQNPKQQSPFNSSKLDTPSRVDSLLQEISEIKQQNDKAKQFYQSQIINLQNTQDQLTIENISLSNSIKGLTQQLQDARYNMHKIFQQTDLDEFTSSIQIDFNHHPNIQQAFYQFQSEIFQFIYLYQSQINQKIQLKQQQLNKIIIKLDSIKNHNRMNYNSINKSTDAQSKPIYIKQTDFITNQNQALEKQFNELKKNHQYVINNFEQEKVFAYQQEQLLKQEFQARIQQLEQQISILLGENQKKESIISELNDLNQLKVLQIQQQEEIQQLKAKLSESNNSQINLNDQIVLLKKNSNSLLNDFEKNQVDLSTLQKEKQYFQMQFEKLQNENMDLIKHQQLLNENQQLQIDKLKQEWQYQNNRLQDQIRIKDQKLTKLQENYNTLQKYKQELEYLLKQSRNEANKFKDQMDQIQQLQTKINKQNYTIQNLIEQNQSQENIINNYASEQKLFEQKIVELQRKNQQIQLQQQPQERESLNQKIYKLQKDNEDKQSEIKILQTDNFELQKQIKQEQVNQQQIKTLITNLQNDRSQYQQQKAQIEQQLDKQQKHNQELLKQMEEVIQNNLNQQEQQTNEWQNQQKMLTKKQVQSEKHLESAFTENEKLRVRISELEYKLEEEIDRNQKLVEETKKYLIDSKQKDVQLSECKSQIQRLTLQLNNIERDKQEQKANLLNDSQQSAQNQEIEQLQLKIKQYQNESKENENQQKQLNQKLQEALKKLEQIQQQLQEEEQLKSIILMKQLQSISENQSSIQPNQDIMDLFDVQTSSRGQHLETILLPESNQSEEQLQLLLQQLKEQNESALQQKSQLQSSLDQAIEKIKQLESQIINLKKEQQSLDNDSNHYQQKISNQQKVIVSLQNQVEELQIELQEQANKSKMAGILQQSTQEQNTFQELINQKDQEIQNLQEELKNIHQHLEQRMNKSVISNHSKKSQNIVKFEEFADIDENDINEQSDEEEELIKEKLQLQKVLQENDEKIRRLEIQLEQTQQFTKAKINQELANLQISLNNQNKVIEQLNTLNSNQSKLLEQQEKQIQDLNEELNRYHQQKDHIRNKSNYSNSFGSDNEKETVDQQQLEKKQDDNFDMQRQVELQNKTLNEVIEIQQLKNECLKEESHNNKDCLN